MAGLTTWISFDASETPLLVACSFGDIKHVQVLISEGADVNKARFDGKTPLMFAVARNCREIVDLLLEAGANIDIENCNGISALQLAINSKCTNDLIIRNFLRIVKTQCPDSKAFLKRLLSLGCSLYHAAIIGDIEIMENISMEVGLKDIQTTYFAGMTTLQAAAFHNDTIVAEWLLDRGAEVNALMAHNVGALFMAAVIGKSSMVRLLLERGANPNVRAFVFGSTPLNATFDHSYGACNKKSDYDECALLLLVNGAVPIQKVGDYPTLVDEALSCENEQRVYMLNSYVAFQEMKQSGAISSEVMDFDIEEHPHAVEPLQVHFEICRKVLEIVIFEKLTLFDLLAASDRQFRRFMRKESFDRNVSAFLVDHDCEENKQYRYYFAVLRNRLEKTPKKCLENGAIFRICGIFNRSYNEFYVFARELVEYLNKKDLEILCKV